MSVGFGRPLDRKMNFENLSQLLYLLNLPQPTRTSLPTPAELLEERRSILVESPLGNAEGEGPSVRKAVEEAASKILESRSNKLGLSSLSDVGRYVFPPWSPRSASGRVSAEELPEDLWWSGDDGLDVDLSTFEVPASYLEVGGRRVDPVEDPLPERRPKVALIDYENLPGIAHPSEDGVDKLASYDEVYVVIYKGNIKPGVARKLAKMPSRYHLIAHKSPKKDGSDFVISYLAGLVSSERAEVTIFSKDGFAKIVKSAARLRGRLVRVSTSTLPEGPKNVTFS